MTHKEQTSGDHGDQWSEVKGEGQETRYMNRYWQHEEYIYTTVTEE